MRVFITGATGLIGRALVLRLRRDGHRIMAWVRSAERAKSLLGAEVEMVETSGGDGALEAALAKSDAIVNLSGEPIIGRWSASKKEKIVASRIEITEKISAAMGRIASKPRVFVSGSAVGYYGDRGDECLNEQSTPGDDFLAKVCVDWERAALRAEVHGVRVVLLRTGVVLGREGGALGKMLTPFKLGLGGQVGSGKQWMSWIHLHDHVEMIVFALENDRVGGPIDATAPNPVTSKEFAKALGHALHRPAIFPVPSLALKAVFGEASIVLLAGQRALPTAVLAAGFSFRYPRLESALSEIVGGDGVSTAANGLHLGA